MSAASSIRAGRAHIEVEARDKTGVTLAKIQQRMRNIGRTMQDGGLAAMRFGGAIVASLAPAIKFAGDLEKAQMKLNTLFGAGAKDINTWADNLSQKVGRSKIDILNSVSQTKTVLDNLLGDPKLADEFSKKLTELGIDMASFFNSTDAEAMTALMAVFRNENDPIERFGVDTKEAAVNLELLNKNIDPKNATAAQKTIARMDAILRQTAKAAGDASRTSETFSNKFKRLQGQAKDAAAAFGTALLPAVNQLLTKGIDIIKASTQWVSVNQALIASWGSLALKVGLAAVGLGVASFAIGKFVTIGAGAVTVIASINKALAATAGMSAWGAIVANITKVGTAVKGLYVLLMANPIYAVAAAVAALTAAWAAYVYATGIVVSTDEKRSNELQTLRAEREELGQTLRALRKYSEAQKLNGDEQTNAKKIIEELTSRYGDLGLSIDAATGKLVGYADAQKKISEIEKQKELDAIKGAIAEKKRNININNSNLDELGSDWFEYNSEEKAENLRRQMEKDQAELRELTQRYIDIQNQTVDVMPSDRTAQDDFEAKEAAAARRQAALDKRNENYKSYAEKKKALDRELMDEEGRAIDDVEEKYKEFFGNLHAMWSDAIRNMDFGEAAKIVEEMKQSRINAEKEIERIRKDAADKRKREAEEEKRKQVELEEQAEKNLQFEYEMYKEIAELKGDVKGAEALQNEIDRIGFERDLIDRFGENEEAKASARGLNAQLIAARKLGAVQSTSAGTFNAAAINAISGGSVQDRIAKATEETAKGVKKLNDKRGGIFVK